MTTFSPSSELICRYEMDHRVRRCECWIALLSTSLSWGLKFPEFLSLVFRDGVGQKRNLREIWAVEVRQWLPLLSKGFCYQNREGLMLSSLFSPSSWLLTLLMDSGPRPVITCLAADLQGQWLSKDFSKKISFSEFQHLCPH
jgi:hypothetical protein